MSIILRDMIPDDWEIGYALTQQNKWAHRPDDWKTALLFGRGTVAEIDGISVGCGMIWLWGDENAIIGHVIVDENHQGKGIGKALMEKLISLSGERTIRLHATQMGEGLYLKLGFKPVGRIHQHQISSLPFLMPQALPESYTIRKGNRSDCEHLTDADYKAQGFFRPEVILHQIENEDVFILEGSARILAMLVVRKFGHGTVIGPIMAKNRKDAELLFSHCVCPLEGQFVRVDTTDTDDFSSWLTDAGIPCIDSPTLMVKGQPHIPEDDSYHIYGMITQSMG